MYVTLVVVFGRGIAWHFWLALQGLGWSILQGEEREQARRRLAIKLQNPRLLQIHFHTLRHWKATMEYHKTKDFMHVKAFLGHKRSDNTDLYIQIEQKLFQETDDDFTIKVAHNAQEAIELGETGFQPFDVIDGVHLYRKRK